MMSYNMLRLIIRIALGLIVLNHLFTPCTAWGSPVGSGFNSGKSAGKGYKEPAKTNTFGGSSDMAAGQRASRRGLGISAWGIIMLIVTLVLAGMGFYYFSMCYPILCKKQRKYDIIELSNV